MSVSTPQIPLTDLVVPQRLRPPRPRADTLVRARLLDRVAGVDTPLVTLTAGAGFGKTTLLRDWTDREPRRCGWVSLDRTDDDPVVLVRHLTKALGDAGVAVQPLELALCRREPRVERDLLPAFAAALEACDEPFLLVLDDVHVVSGDDSLAVLDALLDLVPDQSTVALAARRFPPLRLARRSMDGSVTELSERDLAFGEEEAAAVLRAELPELRPEQEHDLIAFLGGWPAGLHLAVLALRDHPDPHGVVRRLVATDTRVVDYLHEEVLDQLEPPVREFLVRAAVLEVLAAPVCDAVLDRSDSAAVLERLAQSGNLFVSGFEVGQGYHLHELFRDLLLADLRRADPGAEAELRRRAARWFDEQGEADTAMVHALGTGDMAFAARTLYRQLYPTMVAGRVGTLGRWLDGFPRDRIRDDGLVALCAGWHALASGHDAELAHHLVHARTAGAAAPLPDGTRSFEVAVAALEMTSGLDGTLAVAERAQVVLGAGPGGSPWEGLAAYYAATAEALLGRADLVDSLAQAERVTRHVPAAHAVSQALLGWAMLSSGARRTGIDWIERAAAEVVAHDLGDFALTATVHGAVSLSAALEGDHERSAAAALVADEQLARMEHLVPRGTLHTRLFLADAAVRRGQTSEARRHLDLCGDLLRIERDTVVLQEWAAQLQAAVERRQRVQVPLDLTAAERRVLDLLPTHRSLSEIGEHLYVSRNTVKTHTVSIYRKLGVSGRSAAVSRARELGYLDGSDPG